MQGRNILVAINFILLVGLAVYTFSGPATPKNAYVINQQVFEKFRGKSELEEKLRALKNTHKQVLDSLTLQMTAASVSYLREVYEEKAERFALEESEMAEKYTADVWKKINMYVASYGRENGYDFIFGASGDGGLMFAGESNDVTEAVVGYMNARYESE